MHIWQWAIFGIVLVFGFVVFRGAPYVPSQRKYIKEALTKLYPLSAKDTLIDLGSGDGIVLRIASRFGANAVGYELNPVLVIISKLLSIHDKKVRVSLADFWLTNIPDETTVIYVFLVTRDIKKFIKKVESEVERLQKQISVVMHGNEMKGYTPVNKLHAYSLYVFEPQIR